MAIPYIKNDGPNYRVQVGLPAGGVFTFQPTDSASNFTATFPAANILVGDDALAAHLAGTETFSGLKTFSAGINLGQQDLTNYSQGTWTPTLAGGTTPGSPTYTTQSGRYRRVGNLCFVNFDVKLSSVGGMAGSVRVGGLPFTPADTLSCGAIGYMELVTYGAGSYPFLTTSAGNTYLNLFTTASGGTGGQLQASALAATSRIIGSIAFTL